VPESTAGGDEVAWRTIDELAGVVGAYCWLERRLFEVAGAWASEPGPAEAEADAGEAELRVWCAALARRHGDLAGRWAARLPVRAGVDAAALISAPGRPEGLAEALDELAATKERAAGVAGLVETVLPWLGGVYAADLATASPVREGPVMEVLVEARREGSAEIRGGQSLLRRRPENGKPSRHLGTTFERAFVASRVFPAVWAS
jgi:hypothetical protein